MKVSRGCHRLGGAAALRLERLFVGTLRDAHVVNDRGQDFVGVITQLGLGHISARWHQRPSEDGEPPRVGSHRRRLAPPFARDVQQNGRLCGETGRGVREGHSITSAADAYITLDGFAAWLFAKGLLERSLMVNTPSSRLFATY